MTNYDDQVEENVMRAAVGDRLVIKGHHVGEPDKDAEILEVHGEDGAPPWVIRWADDGHKGLYFPGPDAIVEHFEHGEGPSLRSHP